MEIWGKLSNFKTNHQENEQFLINLKLSQLKPNQFQPILSKKGYFQKI